MKKLFAMIFLILAGCQTSSELVYKVKVEKGDTLSRLAKKYGTTVNKIMVLNHLRSVYLLKEGQSLYIISKSNLLDFDGLPNEVASKEVPKSSIFGGQISWPVEGPVISHFGPRFGRQHEGIDIKAKKGADIKAAFSGKVDFVGRMRGYGKTIIIKHDGFKTLYAHCSKLLVKKGQPVKGGQKIGLVGETGNARGPHLHFEYRDRNYQAINPLRFLKGQYYTKK